MASLNDLANRMDKLASDISGETNAVSKEVGIAVLKQLVLNTPVDTSFAVSNWQVGIGSKVSGYRPAFSKGAKGSTRAISAGAAIRDGIDKIKAKQPGETIFISNTAPYIGDLDKGSSRQFSGNFRQLAKFTADVVLRRRKR
jgi:hypothetical protein